ncbi:MAG: DUF4838 domain-containing protein [Armatimonadetes bacterium]|nr:DUF4838 domain-containing protein [Armatimonadota bacterium]
MGPDMLKVLVAMALLGIGACGASAQQLLIAEGGRSDFVIVVADDASPSTKYAAQELQRWLREMTGATLPIVSDEGRMGAHEIILGDNAHLRQLQVDVDFAKLGKEGYVLRTQGPHLIIAGGALRGNLYGVYGLLEDHLGCRWFTPTVSRIPKVDRLVIGPLNETKVPVLEYREPFVRDCFDGDWCARNRVNSSAASLEERHGGKVRFSRFGFVHTFNYLVPPEKYFDEHPEYFSEIDGRRIRDWTQLCCTNEDVIRIVTEEVRRWMREDPEAFVFSVSQNDWGNPCQCANCRAMAAREGSNAGPLLYLVNKVAEAVEEEFPDKAVETLAYQWSRKPPRYIRPRPNVIIRLCSIECCFSHPLESCDSPENRAFREDIEGWSKISNRLWVWNYNTSFSNYLVPFPNQRVRRPNVRFFVRNNVTGIFEQDNYTSLLGELSALGGYMAAKFLWNPDYDENQAMNEFLEGVYGEAAGPIRRYIDLIHDKVERENIHMDIWEGPNAPYLTDDLLAEADRLWDEAEAAVADQPEVLKRVREARLSVDWVMIERTSRPTTSPYRFEGDRYVADVDPAFRKRVDRFFSVAEAGGLTALNEGGMSLGQYWERIAPKVGEFEAIKMAGRDLELRIVPGLGGRILSLRALPDGPSVVYMGDTEDTQYPNAGGYGEWWGGTYQGPGWGGKYETAVRDADGGKVAEMTTFVAEQLKLVRIVQVPAEGTAFTVETQLINARQDEQPADIRGQLALTLGPTDQITAVVPAMGNEGIVSLSMPETEARKDLSFTGAQVAQGVTLANHTTGAGLRVSPLAGDIERAWLRVDARRGVVTWEIKTRGKVGPGATATVMQRVELLRDVSAVPQAQHQPATTHKALRVVGQDDRIGLGRYGEWCWIVEDPTASDGFSVYLNNNHIEWCVQWMLSPAEFEPNTRYEVYARIKVEKTGDGGKAFWAGVYDTVNRADLGSIMPAMTEIPDSEWHLYKLATIVPSKGQYVWMGPQNNFANQKGLYLDYFELRAVEE